MCETKPEEQPAVGRPASKFHCFRFQSALVVRASKLKCFIVQGLSASELRSALLESVGNGWSKDLPDWARVMRMKNGEMEWNGMGWLWFAVCSWAFARPSR